MGAEVSTYCCGGATRSDTSPGGSKPSSSSAGAGKAHRDSSGAGSGISGSAPDQLDTEETTLLTSRSERSTSTGAEDAGGGGDSEEFYPSHGTVTHLQHYSPKRDQRVEQPALDEFGFPIPQKRKQLAAPAVEDSEAVLSGDLSGVEFPEDEDALLEKARQLENQHKRPSIEEITLGAVDIAAAPMPHSQSNESLRGHQRRNSVPISTHLDVESTPRYMLHTASSVMKADRLGKTSPDKHVRELQRRASLPVRRDSLVEAEEAVEHANEAGVSVDPRTRGRDKTPADERAEARARLLAPKRSKSQPARGKVRRTKSMGAFGSYLPRELNWADARY